MRTTRLATAAAVAGLLAATSCTPAPGGGGGGGDPELQSGCFETIFGPDGGRSKIYRQGVAYFYAGYNPGNPACSGAPDSGPTQIFAGNPGASADEFCQGLHGPDASASQTLSNLVVPHQDFWSCNFPL